jgi:hypothetical protein
MALASAWALLAEGGATSRPINRTLDNRTILIS